MTDTRHPYTNAYDLIRCYVGPGVSRSDCAKLTNELAALFGMEHEDFCSVISIAYQTNTQMFTEVALNHLKPEKQSAQQG